MSRKIRETLRNLKSLPRAYSGTGTGHTPRDGAPRHRRLAALALCLLLVGSVVAPIAFVGTASAVPSGMVGVPDSNVSEDFPVGEAQNASLRASDLEGSVMAGEYANSLEVIVTTPDRARSYVSTNDTATLSGDSGVALVLRDNTHSQGREVALDAGAVRDALGHTPEQVYGTHENGEEWTADVTYEAGMLVFEVPHFSTNSVTFASQVSISGTFTSGSTVSYDVTSVDSVENFSVEFEGTRATETDSFAVSRNSSGSSTIAGDEIPSSADVTLSTDPGSDATGTLSEDVVEGETYTFTVTDPPRDPDQISLDLWNAKNADGVITVESPDGTTLVNSSWSSSSDFSTITKEMSSIQNYDSYTINFHLDFGGDGTTDVDIDTYSMPAEDIDSADVTVDGNTHTFSGPGTTTLSLDSDSSVDASVTATGGDGVTATVDYQETAYTRDPAVEVNGNTTSYTGTLQPGETVSVSPDTADVQESNTVNVSLSSLADSDAPAPSVNMTYQHDAQDKQLVDYEAEKWSERYNVSKTFASDRPSASLTIPFDGNVVKIQSLETRTNGGSWSTASTDTYTFDGTELSVQLGSVDSGDEVAVRTTARKVNVINGSITVLEPTVMGNRLDTKFEIDSWSSDAHISVGSTPDGTRINYLYKESWSADEYAEVTADGYHRLHAPGASTGSTARVSTIPVRVNAQSGEVHIRVADPLRDEPKFQVSPGSTEGDAVEYTFVDAQDDTSYALYSLTRDTAVDQGTANSPLTLSDDDSDETLQFQLDDSDGGNTSGDGGSGGFFGQSSSPVIPAMPVLNPGLVVVIVLGIIAGAIAYQQRRVQRPDVPDRDVHRSPLVWLSIGIALFIGVLLISPETVTTWFTLVLAQPLSNALNAALPLAGVLGVMAGIGILVYWWWSRRQAKQADASTPDTVLRISANKGDDK